jgi:hypothetical protein
VLLNVLRLVMCLRDKGNGTSTPCTLDVEERANWETGTDVMCFAFWRRFARWYQRIKNDIPPFIWM